MPQLQVIALYIRSESFNMKSCRHELGIAWLDAGVQKLLRQHSSIADAEGALNRHTRGALV